MKKIGKKNNSTYSGIHAYAECMPDYCRAGFKCSCSGTPTTEYNIYWNLTWTRMLSGLQLGYS